MLRIGVQFEKLVSTEQSAWDRFVFQQMRRVAHQWRHLRGELYQPSFAQGAERRDARRVPLENKQLRIEIEILPPETILSLEEQAKQVAHALNAPLKKPQSIKICDISSTGCAFLCPEEGAPKLKSLIRIHFIGEGFSLKLTGRVIYAFRQSTTLGLRSRGKKNP